MANMFISFPRCQATTVQTAMGIAPTPSAAVARWEICSELAGMQLQNSRVISASSIALQLFQLTAPRYILSW